MNSLARFSTTALLVLGLAAATAGAPAAARADAPSLSSTYQIRPGDSLSISVFNEPTLTQPLVVVPPGGIISEPLVGQIRVGGLTPAQAGNAVSAALLKYVRHPQVTVAVAAIGPMDVYVLGNVKLPGKYALQPNSRLMDALAAAGGLGPTDGDLPDARLSDGPTVKTVSLQRLLHEGDLTLDAPIDNQMTIYVPSPIVFTIQVNGAVDHPGDIPMHEGDRLVNAIARAGSSPGAHSDLNHVTVRHTAANGTVESKTVDMYAIYKDGDASKDILMAKGDTVFVPATRSKTDYQSPLQTILYGLLRF